MSGEPLAASAETVGRLLAPVAAVCAGRTADAQLIIDDTVEAGQAAKVLSAAPVAIRLLFGISDWTPGSCDGLLSGFAEISADKFSSEILANASLLLASVVPPPVLSQQELLEYVSSSCSAPGVPVWSAVAGTWYAAEVAAAALEVPSLFAVRQLCRAVAALHPHGW